MDSDTFPAPDRSPTEERLEQILVAAEADPDFDYEAAIEASGPLAAECRAAIKQLHRAQLLPHRVNIESTAEPQLGPRYAVEHRIAAGGMGELWRAVDRRLGRLVAIKVARTGPVDSIDRYRSRLQREARIASTLEHPNIIPIYELGDDAHGRPFISMKLVEGETLSRRLVPAKSPTDPNLFGLDRRVQVVIDTCRAVAHAHSQGIVHRDLKPDNIMVGAFGETLVMDWGLARRVGELALDKRTSPLPIEDPHEDPQDSACYILGTPSFMAPEQARAGMDRTSPAVDVFGLGALLFFALTGKSPYRGLSGAETVQHACEWTGNAAFREHWPTPAPRELRAICRRAMAFDPAERYTTASSMANDLVSYLEHRPGLAWKDSPLQAARKAYRRHRFAFTRVALVAMGLAIVALGYQYAGSENQQVAAKELAALSRVEQLPPLHGPGTPAATRAWILRAEALRTQPQAAAIPDLGGEELLEGQSSILERMRRRLRYLELTLPTLQATGNLAAGWRESIRSIARPDGPYAGLKITPQAGLVPIGTDPASGLWEFAYPVTGSIPTRDSETGQLRCEEDSALVLVLIPSGRFDFGDFSPGANEDEWITARRNVEVEAFFLSKYELTQAQYLAVMGQNPSRRKPPGESDSDRIQSLRHPVERISQADIRWLNAWLELRLPDEYEWEYAGRARTTTRWYTGDSPESLEGHANLLDRSGATVRPKAQITPAPWDDLYRFHAPVGSFLPNPFGLYDVHGNVWENVAPVGDRVPLPARGGSFGSLTDLGHVSDRSGGSEQGNAVSGLRPAKDLSFGPK